MKRYLMMCLMACLLLACREDEPGLVVTPDADGATFMRVTVDIASAIGSTRSNPTGGEEGDGTITGHENETKIHDLCLFIYEDSANLGLDNPENTPIVASAFVAEDQVERVAYAMYEATFPIKNYQYKSSHRVLVAANAGNITYKMNTLGQVRDYMAIRSWTAGDQIQNASRFVMATAYPKDGAISVINYNVGNKENPNFKAESYIERLAARVDIMADENTVMADHVAYSVPDSKGNQIASIRLTHAMLINSMQHPSYLVKRTTPNTKDFTSFLYAGDETMTGAVPTNYVIDPFFSHKNGKAIPYTLNYWYGESAAFNILANKDKLDWDKAALSNFTQTLANNVAGAPFPKYFTLAYTNENTMEADMHTSEYCTGLLLRTEYIPTIIYTSADKSSSISPSSATTFWRYRPTLREFEEEKCLYFSTQETAEKYREAHPEDLAEIQEFTDGLAYYTVWIRHANDNFAPSHADPYPMEFGIVRNNIYRIGFRFTGPGTPTPDIEEPHSIDVNIFVRKWNLREQSEIYM